MVNHICKKGRGISVQNPQYKYDLIFLQAQPKDHFHELPLKKKKLCNFPS